MNSKLKFLILSLAAIFLAGCTLTPNSTQTTNRPDGGVWRSADAGKTFVQANDLLATKGKVLSLVTLNVAKLIIDPQDTNTIYAATEANGLFYSLDGGVSWQQFKNLNAGYIRDVAVDSNNKCVIYAVTANKLLKTENCGRDWNNIYYHQKNQVILNTIVADPKNNSTLYIGTSEGDILKSADAGLTWLAIFRAKSDKIMDIIVDPYESQTLYAGAARTGIFKSLDGGKSWNSLGEGLKSYTGSQGYKKLIYDPATVSGLIFISKFGMLRSIDGGKSWKVIDLLPANKTAAILAVAVNPENSAEIFYATASTLVATIDSGLKWSSTKLPYNHLTTGIYINPSNPKVMYLTTELPQ